MSVSNVNVALGAVVAIALGATLVQLFNSDVGKSFVGGVGQHDISDNDEALFYKLQPDRSPACGSISGEPMARVVKCFEQLQPSKLSAAARETITDALGTGKVLAAAKIDVAGDVIQLADDEPLREALMGADERVAAAALRERGVRGVVVSRDLMGALDRDSRTLARLARHAHLEWFQLRHVTEDLFIYTVRASDNRIPLATGDRLLKGLRARINGDAIPRQTWKPSGVRLIGTMRTQGHTIAIRHAVGNSLESVLDELASKLVREWERNAEPDGHGSIADRKDDIRLEIHVVMERAPVEPRSRWQIFDLWELGVDGMIFSQRPGVKEDKFTYVAGAEAMTRAHKSADQFLRYAVKTGGWIDARPWEDTRTRLDIIRTEHFMEREKGGGGVAVRLVRGMPEVPLAYVNDRTVRQMLVDGGEWWLENQFGDGSFEYKYWPEQNRRSTEYNEVRHILAPRDLADVWRYRNDDRYLVGAQRAMDWLMKYAVYGEDPPVAGIPHPVAGSLLFRYPSVAESRRINKAPNQKLGTVAVALLAWVAWADASGSKEQDVNIRKMAKFVRSQIGADGAFQAYYVERGHPYYGNKNDIVPGEAALALGMVSEYFGEPDWVDFYPKFLDYYEPWFRSRASKKNAYGRWPHNTYDNNTRLDLVQFGPWAVMASKQYYTLTGDKRAATFGLEIADWMIDNYQWTGARTPWPDYVGGYYKLPNELPAMQSFCYSEGTAAAYHIASTFAVDRAPKYELSTREAIRFLEVMQYDEIDSYFVSRPKKVFGGVKYAMNENKIRTDYVGHGLSTLSQFLDARRYDPAVTQDLPDPAAIDTPRAANPADIQAAPRVTNEPEPEPMMEAEPVDPRAGGGDEASSEESSDDSP